MDEMMLVAEWSDKFFNYVPALQSYDGEDSEFEAAAAQFLETNPECPFDVKWLIKDFGRRL